MEFTPSLSRKEKLSDISVLILLFLVLYFRNPLLFSYPTPASEDLPIFLGQEYSIGFPETVFITYSGYIHLLPRIIAWISMKFELSNAMVVMNWSVLLIKILTFYLIYKSEEIKSGLIKFSLLAYLVLIPFAEGIYNNVTNLQWWLIPLMAIIILKRETSKTSLLLSCFILVLTGLTGVNSIMFAVPCAYLLFKVKTKEYLIKTIIIVISSCIQIYCLISSPRIGKIDYNAVFTGGGAMDNRYNQSVC